MGALTSWSWMLVDCNSNFSNNCIHKFPTFLSAPLVSSISTLLCKIDFQWQRKVFFLVSVNVCKVAKFSFTSLFFFMHHTTLLKFSFIHWFYIHLYNLCMLYGTMFNTKLHADDMRIVKWKEERGIDLIMKIVCFLTFWHLWTFISHCHVQLDFFKLLIFSLCRVMHDMKNRSNYFSIIVCLRQIKVIN